MPKALYVKRGKLKTLKSLKWHYGWSLLLYEEEKRDNILKKEMGVPTKQHTHNDSIYGKLGSGEPFQNWLKFESEEDNTSLL